MQPILPGSDRCHGFSFSADSLLLATIVSGINAAQVWDPASGWALSRPLPHPGDAIGVYSVCFSPNGSRLLTSGKDGQVRHWDWRAGKLSCPPLLHANEVLGAAFTPDGKFAVSTVRGKPSRVEIWGLLMGKRIAPPVRLGLSEDDPETLAITPDSRRVLVVDRSKMLFVIDLEAILSPLRSPTADFAAISELATAHRIELGDLSGLTTTQWLDRWESLQKRNAWPVRPVVTELGNAGASQAAVGAAQRGYEFARWGHWARAAKEALAEVAAYPDDRLAWSKAASRLLMAGDTEGYRSICGRMIRNLRRRPTRGTPSRSASYACYSPTARTARSSQPRS